MALLTLPIPCSSTEKENKIARKNNIVFFGAHPDDIELGCLGTIMNYSEKGKNITCIIATDGESGNPNSQKFNRIEESLKCLTGAGLREENIMFLHLPDRKLELHKLAIIEKMESVCNEREIGTAFIHTNIETHQDHKAVYEATTSAGRNLPAVLIFESNSSTLSDFSPKYFVDIGPYIDRKVSLLRHHESQSDRKYMEISSVAALARVRGTQSKIHAYAEGYEIFRISEL